jgi:octaprenyl-diphosphate synthase
MELEKIIRPVRPELDAVKNSYASQLKARFEPVNGIGRYLSRSRGKFFRPTLLLLSAKSGGKADLGKAVSVGVAVELIHAASLIHDDIIDEAALRRNRKTVNSKWGNAISVIAGDYLLAKAFHIISKLNDTRLLSAFSKTASRMCEGEMAQLANAYNFEVTERQYLDIIKRKSAYLLSDCCAVGGMLGNLSDRKTRRLAAYGLNLGIAFQIVDDCLDLTGDESDLGKSVWQDMDEGKLTLPLIFMLRNANRKNRIKLVELITLGGNTAHRILKGEAVNSGAITRSKKVASSYIKSAKEKLGDCNGVLKKTFCDIADYVLERKS